jgi:site-specific recombinase
MSPVDPTRDLTRLLDAALADPSARALEALLRWLLKGPAEPTGPTSPRAERLTALAAAVEAHPRTDRLRIKLGEIWAHRSAVRLLAETGLPTHGTLIKEAIERTVDRLAPRFESDADLYLMISRLPLTDADALWVASRTDSELAPWTPILAPLGNAVPDAARLVAVRAGALGLGRALLDLRETTPDGESPFLRLPAAVDALALHPADPDARERFVEVRDECAAVLSNADHAMEVHGVSTDLLYQLELLRALLHRLDHLTGTMTGETTGAALGAELIRASVQQHGIRSLARQTMKRLALKVTEHTAETGEHYVVRDRREWEATSRSAAGGGALTAVTALLKYVLASAPLAPLVQGLAATLNFSASFFVMQLAHFTLASKQPAMTGAALASVLGDRDEVRRQVELVAGITRSQVAATLGNVLATIPMSAVIVVLARWLGGEPPLSEETAIHSVHSVHPFRSLTIPFAMVTGVFLWIASLGAGWAANWSAYRGLPQALEKHRGLWATIGAERARRFGGWVDRNLSGLVGYLVLGFLLGFVPVAFDRFIGLGLEVRHVTLQAASLTLAAGSLYGTEAFHWGEVAWGALSIFLIGTANFGVSFVLALRTAARARDLGLAERRRLGAALRAAFRADPRRFLWRPRKPTAPAS